MEDYFILIMSIISALITIYLGYTLYLIFTF